MRNLYPILLGIFFAVLFYAKDGFADDKPSEEDPPSDMIEWKESTQYTRLRAQFTIHALNYATDAKSEFQEFALGDKDHYEFRLNLGYITLFGDEAFHFGLGGDYHFFKRIRISTDAALSPAQTVVPRQAYRLGLFPSFFKKTLETGISYEFKDFRQANQHVLTPLVRLNFFERVSLTGMFRYDRTLHAGGGFDNQAFEVRSDFLPVRPVTLSGFYGRSLHDFEAGAPDNPFKGFSAHDFGGGIKLSFLAGNGFYFEYRGQDRDNGQTVQTYTLGTFFEM